MSAYGSFLYGSGTKYGTSSASAPRWSFLIDWDEDGFYDSPNEAEYMTGLMIERGRDYYIGANSDRFEPIQAGRATITLSNHDGRYNPYNVSSPLYPNLDSGKFIQLRVKYGTTIYTVFTGVITDIQQTGLNDTVRIVAEDGINWLTNQPANPMPNPISTDSFADWILARILDGAAWPSLWGYDLANGNDFYPFWWADNGNTWEEIKSLLDSELAFYCIRADGSFYYRSRQSSPAAVLSLTEDQLEKNVYIPAPWEFRKNIVKFTGVNVDTATKFIWESNSEIAIAPGETKTVIAEYSNPSITFNSIQYSAYSQSGGVGTDLSGGIYWEFGDIGSTNAALSFRNNNATLAYVSAIKINGIELTKTNISGRAAGTESTTRPRSLDMTLAWQQNANSLNDFATQMLAFLNTSQPFPVVTIDNRPDIQFTPDMFDVVSVDLSSIGINTSFRVGKITHEWTIETGLATKTTLGLEPYRLYTGYWIFDSDAILDTSLLGW